MKKIHILLTILLITSLVFLCSGCAEITSSTKDIPTSGTLTITVSETYTAADEPEEFAKYSALTDAKITEDSYVKLISSTFALEHEVIIPADKITLKSTDYTADETQVVMEAIVDISYSGLYKSAAYRLDATTLSFELSDGTNTIVVPCSNGLSLVASHLTTEADDDVKEIVLYFPNGEPYAGGSPEPIKVHSVNGDKSKNYLANLSSYEWAYSPTESVNPNDYTIMTSGENTFKKDMSYCFNLRLQNVNNVVFSPNCEIYLLTSDGVKKPLEIDLLELPTPGVTPSTPEPPQYISSHMIFTIKDDPVINAVSISSEISQVEKGRTQLFTVKVDRAGNAPNGVTWSISGNVSEETKIDDTGLLTVGADETAETLTISITSVFDPTKTASIKVAVIEPIATPEPPVQPTAEPTANSTTTPATSSTAVPTPTVTPASTATPAPTVTVKPTKTPVKKSVKFKKKSVKIKKGKKITLKVTVKGAKKAKFSVNKKGKKVVKLMKKKAKSVVVKGKKKGKAFVYAKAGNKKAKCTVKVK